MVGQTLAHYKILEKIGSGGMGDVYLAEDTKLDRKVALKILPPELAEEPMALERFRREAKAIAALTHPNVVNIYSVEEEDDTNFITMEYLTGVTLGEMIGTSGLSLKEFFDIAVPLTGAVAAAHEKQIIHRDLKPANVMVTTDGDVKVLDFGLALPRQSVALDTGRPTELKTSHGAILGTIHYMSPEQARGEVIDERSDIFSLGVMFYQMLTGQLPFRGDSAVSILSAILTATPTPLKTLRPETPSPLCETVGRCLAKDAGERYQSASEIKSVLIASKNGPARAESVVEPTTPGNVRSGGKSSASSRGKKLSCSFSLAIGFTTASLFLIVLMHESFLRKGISPEVEMSTSSRQPFLEVLGSYERAIETQNVDLLRQVRPNLTQDEETELLDSFARIDSHDVEFAIVASTIQGNEAVLDVLRTDSAIVGGKLPADLTRRRQTFRLERVDGDWRIVFVGKARPVR